ncbi:tripartite tricarboxylate transporter substrate binding protein [Sporosarcina sp.]|uniref:Bug family tripartite tricarboxylate transporter substrate binding protein n=1 Tax=Sporosarcina sp. TaxID=49982 RepID=UPI00263997F4|nr:tripartite tricarboxylate transporter substrate binding protein [Sporosarcina sp.]
MKRFLTLSIVFTIAMMTAACSSNAGEKESSTDKYPAKTLNAVIPFGPGGGTDLYLRKIMEIMQKEDIYTDSIKIENREGGSGAVGWGFLETKKGDPYFVGPTSGSFFTTPLVSETAFSYDSFTPIALMGADDLFFLVKGESKYGSLEDFIEATKSGKKMKIGGVGQVSDEMIVPNLFAKEAGFDFDYVPFQGAGELTSALLSDSLDAIVGNPARSMGQIEGGLMKPLAFSGLERLKQLEDVPTFTELGYDVNISQPRGVVLPADIDDEVKDWWIDAMKKVAETDEWKKYILDNGMSDYILFGDDFSEFLEETNTKFKDSLESANQ